MLTILSQGSQVHVDIPASHTIVTKRVASHQNIGLLELKKVMSKNYHETPLG